MVYFKYQYLSIQTHPKSNSRSITPRSSGAGGPYPIELRRCIYNTNSTRRTATR